MSRRREMRRASMVPRQPTNSSVQQMTDDLWGARLHDDFIAEAVEAMRYIDKIHGATAALPERAAELWTPPPRPREQAAWAPPVVEHCPSDPPPPLEGLARLQLGWTVPPPSSGRLPEPWTYPLWTPGGARSGLFSGIPESGKTRGVYRFLAEVAPWCHGERRVVELHGFDPKMVGFNIAEPLFTHLWTPDGEGEEGEPPLGTGAAEGLRTVVRRMKKRLRYMKAHRLTELVPTPDEPLNVVIVDEMAELVNAETPKEIRLSISASLASLVRWGRAPGMPVLIATQDPNKEIMQWRDSLAIRVGYQMSSNEQIVMGMGPDARAKGAKCDEITTPGEAYVWGEGKRYAQRVMTKLVENDELTRIADLYAAPGRAPA